MIRRVLCHIMGRWYERRAYRAIERDDMDKAVALFQRAEKYFSAGGVA